MKQVKTPAKPKTPNKATTALASTVDKVATVLAWIVSGASEYEIVETIRKHWPSEKSRPLIAEAMKRIAATGTKPDLASVHGWALEATRRVYQVALETGDTATALRAVKQLEELAAGTNAPAAEPICKQFNLEELTDPNK